MIRSDPRPYIQPDRCNWSFTSSTVVGSTCEYTIRGGSGGLLASLAESGQQTPIVVVAVVGQPDRYVVIDGHKRITALQQLGRDKVEAVVWPMSEAEAVVLDRSLRLSEHETALEVGWLLAELEQRFGYGLDELARRFDRSVSWISRRLALVEAFRKRSSSRFAKARLQHRQQ